MKMKTQCTQTYGHIESSCKRQVTVLSDNINELETSHISNLATHLKSLEQQEEIIPQKSQGQYNQTQVINKCNRSKPPQITKKKKMKKKSLFF